MNFKGSGIKITRNRADNPAGPCHTLKLSHYWYLEFPVVPSPRLLYLHPSKGASWLTCLSTQRVPFARILLQLLLLRHESCQRIANSEFINTLNVCGMDLSAESTPSECITSPGSPQEVWPLYEPLILFADICLLQVCVRGPQPDLAFYDTVIGVLKKTTYSWDALLRRSQSSDVNTGTSDPIADDYRMH